MTFLLLMRNTSRKTRADTERCLTIVFTTSTSLLVLPTLYCFFPPQLTSISEIISGTIDVPTLQPSELHAIHQVLLNMIRVKEKRDLVGILNYADCIFLVLFHPAMFSFTEIDILGTSQVVNIIKELWTVFDEPIALLCKANLGKHLERMLKATKAIVKVCSIFPFYF